MVKGMSLINIIQTKQKSRKIKSKDFKSQNKISIPRALISSMKWLEADYMGRRDLGLPMVITELESRLVQTGGPQV